MSENKSPTSIFETTAVLIERSIPKKGTGATVVRNISELLRSFGTGDNGRIEEAFQKLGGNSQNDLYQQLGQMTRNLHQALQDFNASLTRDPHHMQSTNIGDAAIKLENVMKMTSEATHKTLASTETQANVIEKCKERNKALADLVASGGSSEQITKLLAEQTSALEVCESCNSEILMAQSFQDLSGQAVKKVITLVTDLELNLVSMIKIFGVQDTPQHQTEITAPKLEQDAVDSILSDFGF